MDSAIRTLTIAEAADQAARLAVTTGEPQANPHTPGTSDAIDWQQRYEVALLRHSAAPDGEGTA